MTARWSLLDTARGLAVLAMVAFHLVWDLGHFGYIDSSIPWSAPVKAAGHGIAFSFLFIAGVSLVLAHGAGVDWRAFLRRFFIIAGAAALVSVGTYAVFPGAFVFFGILHCIAAASLLSILLVSAPWPAAAALGVLFFAAPEFFSSPRFNSDWLQWVGLGTIVPITQDWRPFFPWAGAMLAGVGAARALHFPASLPRSGSGASPGWGGKGMGFLGRHSLAVYLLHQPLLFGLFTALLMIAPPAQDAAAFVAECERSCVEKGSSEVFCYGACACTAEEARRSGALVGVTDETERGRRLRAIASRCVAVGK